MCYVFGPHSCVIYYSLTQQLYQLMCYVFGPQLYRPKDLFTCRTFVSNLPFIIYVRHLSNLPFILFCSV